MSRVTRRSFFAVLAASILFVFGSCGSTGSARSADQDSRPSGSSVLTDCEVTESVQAFLERYLRILEGQDASRVRELYVQDERFAWFTDGAKAYSSREEVLVGLKSFSGMRFKTNLSDAKVTMLSKHLASVSTLFRTDVKNPQGQDFGYDGVITMIVARATTQADWQVMTGHTSTSGGPPSAEAYGQ